MLSLGEFHNAAAVGPRIVEGLAQADEIALIPAAPIASDGHGNVAKPQFGNDPLKTHSQLPKFHGNTECRLVLVCNPQKTPAVCFG